MSKKALIVTYYWPPAGGPGVQRWLYFSKYLPKYNIEPVVFVPKNPDYPIVDSALTDQIGADVKVVKFPILEPYALAKKMSKQDTATMSKGVFPKEQNQSFIQKCLLWIRGNIFIPDARVLWVKPSIHFLKKYIIKHQIDVVITTGPPHSVHLIGLGLKEKLGIKWIADFRDPWTTIGYHSKLKLNKRAQRKHQFLEKKVLDTTDLVLVTSKGTLQHFKTKTNTGIKVITNGYEPDNETIKSVLDEKFTISHIGSLLSDRNPEVLWEVLAELVEEEKNVAKQLQLQFVGIVSDTIIESVKSYGLEKFVDNRGYVSHEKAVTIQKKSQILLLVEIDSEETKQIIPGKLFEYLKAQRPILALAPKGSEIAEIITATQSGEAFCYNDKELLKTYIYNCFRLYEKQLLNSSTIDIEKYTRKSLAGELALEIQKL